VRVHVTSAGICGTDLHMLALPPSPVVLGHEFAGLLDDGRPVAVQPYVPCGDCPACRAGRSHLCSPGVSGFYGVARDGGMAGQVMVDPGALVFLPVEVDPSCAALVEPLAVVLHGLHRVGDLAGLEVLVIGGGSVGLLAVAACRRMGASVDLLARHRAQWSAGASLGADTNLAADYDVVVDAAGSQAALDEAVARVRPGGTVLELAMFWEPITVPFQLLGKEVTLLPSLLYGHHHGRREFDEAAALLAAMPEVVPAVVTHRFSLEQAPEAFATAADRRSGAIKVHFVIDPAP